MSFLAYSNHKKTIIIFRKITHGVFLVQSFLFLNTKIVHIAYNIKQRAAKLLCSNKEKRKTRNPTLSTTRARISFFFFPNIMTKLLQK